MRLNPARLLLTGILLLATTALADNGGRAVQVDIEGAIGPATADYIRSAFRQASERDADIIVLRMDTPGGLMEAMRDIIKEILHSPIPVVAWVGPDGARADSAGTYILFATHVAAMATTTHLGAATPVSMTGDDAPSEPVDEKTEPEKEPSGAPADDAATEQDGSDAEPEPAERAPATAPTAMERKVLNDAVTYIRSLAEKRGRNADWAESAVIDAATLTATEALAQNVIEIIADDVPALLKALDGRTVQIGDEEITLSTTGMTLEKIEPTWRQKLLSAIASPEIALLLLMVGIYGLYFEGYNPGAIIPGVVGAVCLLLAAYALNVMPVNYVGLGLVILGIVLLIAEMLIPSFGALGVGGVISFVIGSIMMFDVGVPGYEVSLWFVGSVAAITGAGMLGIGYYALRLVRRGPVSGREQILSDIAVAKNAFDAEGTVWLEGEEWQARTRVPVAEGQKLRVVRIDGLILEVEPLGTTG